MSKQETTCIHCGSDKIIEKPLKDKKENPKQTKFYHTCDSMPSYFVAQRVVNQRHFISVNPLIML